MNDTRTSLILLPFLAQAALKAFLISSGMYALTILRYSTCLPSEFCTDSDRDGSRYYPWDPSNLLFTLHFYGRGDFVFLVQGK